MAIVVTNKSVLLRVMAEAASQEWTQEKMYFLNKESIFEQKESLTCTGFYRTFIFLSEEL